MDLLTCLSIITLPFMTFICLYSTSVRAFGRTQCWASILACRAAVARPCCTPWEPHPCCTPWAPRNEVSCSHLFQSMACVLNDSIGSPGVFADSHTTHFPLPASLLLLFNNFPKSLHLWGFLSFSSVSLARYFQAYSTLALRIFCRRCTSHTISLKNIIL